MADKLTFDPNLVRQLAELLNETDLNEIEYAISDHRVRVVRHRQEVVVPQFAPAVPAAPQSTRPEAGAAEVEDFSAHPGAVKSPLVGNAYMAAEPGATPFVKEGDTVSAGQTLLIIEAMKVMNPIKAPKSGKVKKIFAQDGKPVEFDELLMIVE